jgi:trans-aconitate methyltransferase
MTASQQLAAIPAADIALLGGGRVADIGGAAGRSTIDIALAYPEALVDAFDDDAAAIEAARAQARAARITGRVAFRHVDAARLRRADLPAYDVVVAPAHLREAAGLLAGDGAVLVVREP